MVLPANDAFTEEQLKSTIGEYEDRIREMEIELASRRSLEKVMIYLGYAAIAIGIVGGIFGYSEISDIDRKVSSLMSPRISQVDEKLKLVDSRLENSEKRLSDSIENAKQRLGLEIDNRIATYVSTTEDRLREFKSLGPKINDYIKNLEESEIYWRETIKPRIDITERFSSDDEDLKGFYLSLIGQKMEPEAVGYEERRVQAIALLKEVTKQIKQQASEASLGFQFTPAEIFNMAQMSRQIGRTDLERELTSAVFSINPDPPARALFLQAEAQRFGSEEADKAFEELLLMVEELTIDSPHIVAAEAWNAAEGLRKYGKLIGSIDALIQRNKIDNTAFLPSFVFALKGNAHQRRGLPGDLDLAVEAYVHAIERLAVEGMLAQWADATINNVFQYMPVLLMSGADIAPIVDAARASKIQPVKMQMQMIASLAGAGVPPEDDVQKMIDELLRKWNR